jgi:hypothetical protein
MPEKPRKNAAFSAMLERKMFQKPLLIFSQQSVVSPSSEPQDDRSGDARGSLGVVLTVNG